MDAYVVGLILGTLFVIVISKIWSVLAYVMWRPYVITKKFREQGIKGPEYKLWTGSIEEIKRMKKDAQGVAVDINSHDFTTSVFPYYAKWISEYGGTFLFWFGPRPTLGITNPDMVKEVLSNKFGYYTKNDPNPHLQALVGKGLVLINGQDWARHRRVVNPAFTMDKLKMMTETMAQIAQSMMEGWEAQMLRDENKQAEIDLSLQFKELTADVISHTAFGSSYKEGKEVFLAQEALQILAVANMLKVQVPGFNYLPTSKNLQKWKLKRKVRNMLVQIIQARYKSKESGRRNDLLGLMLEACASGDGVERKENCGMNMDEIIDECKTFFLAGHETTSHLLTWTVFLLCTNQEWQEKLREEVRRECGEEVPDADMLSKLKLVTMVLFETLRLYGPVPDIQRKAAKDMELGSLKIPKDTVLAIPIVMIHRNKELWGPNANEFDPSRFENGIAKAAKHPSALLPFSIGPRSCIGQNFAMLEAKTVIAMLLQRFSFSISPKYVHAPINLLTLQPKYGLPVILKPLHV